MYLGELLKIPIYAEVLYFDEPKANGMKELFDYNGINSVEDWRNQDRRKRKWPWELLELDESFLAKIPLNPKKRATLKNAGLIWRMNNDAMDRKFNIQNVHNGYLVTRVI